jgi:hypothetical protein
MRNVVMGEQKKPLEIVVVCEDQESMRALHDAQAPEGVDVRLRKPLIESTDAPDIILGVVFLILSVPASVLANHIYNKLAGKKTKKIRINRTEIEFERGKISRLIHEEFEKEDN